MSNEPLIEFTVEEGQAMKIVLEDKLERATKRIYDGAIPIEEAPIDVFDDSIDVETVLTLQFCVSKLKSLGLP